MRVYKKSEIEAPNGPPRFCIDVDEFLLKNPESETSYETKDIKIYSEKAMRKKLKKFKRVFFIYGGIYLVNLIIVVIIGINRNNFFIFNYNFRNV